MTGATIRISSPGTSATIQDAGRHGYEQLGVTTSGAMDRRSVERANTQVGNDRGDAVIESLFGGVEFSLSESRWCSLAGAFAAVTVDDEHVPDPALFWAPAGAQVKVGLARRGLYAYLAVSGGLQPRRILGSASTDTLSGIGPARLAAGHEIGLGTPGTPIWNTDTPALIIPGTHLDAQFLWGPRDGLFSDDDRALLVDTEWIVSSDANRVGARVDGARLAADLGSLPSEGVVRGSIQIPPSGQPIIFLADHPVTGGYPVIGVLVEPAQDLVAQARPGTRIRLHSQ